MSDFDKTASRVIEELSARVMALPEQERSNYIEMTVCMGVAMMRGSFGDQYVHGFLSGALADLEKPAVVYEKKVTLQ